MNKAIVLSALLLFDLLNPALAEDLQTCMQYCNSIAGSCQEQGNIPDCQLKVVNCKRDCRAEQPVSHGFMTEAQCKIIGENLGSDGWCR